MTAFRQARAKQLSFVFMIVPSVTIGAAVESSHHSERRFCLYKSENSIMKKRFKPMMLILFLLLVAYTVFAAWKTHGIGIYGIGNTIGRILAVSWHYTALAAVIILLLFVILLFTRKTREKHGKIAPAAAHPEASAAESKGKPVNSKRKKDVKQKTTEKVPTAAPLRAAEPAIAPAAPIAAAEPSTQAPAPVSDETVLLTEDTPIRDASTPSTEDTPVSDPDATVLLTETESASNEKKDASVFCEKCGAELAAGVKFCSKCGTRTHVE